MTLAFYDPLERVLMFYIPQRENSLTYVRSSEIKGVACKLPFLFLKRVAQVKMILLKERISELDKGVSFSL